MDTRRRGGGHRGARRGEGGRDEAEKAEGEQQRPSTRTVQEEGCGSPFREQSSLRCGRVDEVMGRGGREWQGCVRNASYFGRSKVLRPVGVDLGPCVFACLCVFCVLQPNVVGGLGRVYSSFYSSSNKINHAKNHAQFRLHLESCKAVKPCSFLHQLFPIQLFPSTVRCTPRLLLSLDCVPVFSPSFHTH